MTCYDITLPADVPETQRIPSAGSSLRIWKQVIHYICYKTNFTNMTPFIRSAPTGTTEGKDSAQTCWGQQKLEAARPQRRHAEPRRRR